MNNSFPVFREARVVDTTDPEKLGRIQLKVFPELSDIPDNDCPWCFSNDGGIHGKSFGVPLVGSIINCIVWNKYFNEITFLPFTISKPTEHLFNDWICNYKSKITDMGSSPEEEHFAVEQFEDNFSIFHDTKNSQHGFLHSSGTYVLIDKSGKLFIFSKNGVVVESSQNTLLKIGNAVDTLGGVLDELMTALSNLQTSGSPTDHTASVWATANITPLRTKINQIFDK